MADDLKPADTVEASPVEQAHGDRADGAREDDHRERSADETVGEQDDERRRVTLAIEACEADPRADPVREPVVGRGYDPSPR